VRPVIRQEDPPDPQSVAFGSAGVPPVAADMPAEGGSVEGESHGAGQAGISADGGRRRGHARSCGEQLVGVIGKHGSLALPTRVLRPNKALLEGLLTPG
jgi:hypothetical protein